MKQLEDIERELAAIHERNARVEADKAWETSASRKLLIAVLTYAVIVVFFFFAGFVKPFINAIVPTLGFLLSTLSISVFKKLWIQYCYHR